MEQQGHEPERILKGPATELEFFEAVYLNENLPLGYRLKAAAERAKYTHAQVRAMAVGHMDGKDFASMLERAILRSQSSYVTRALPASEQHPASELKGNFPVRRRNLR
jgi:hypothetical protein